MHRHFILLLILKPGTTCSGDNAQIRPGRIQHVVVGSRRASPFSYIFVIVYGSGKNMELHLRFLIDFPYWLQEMRGYFREGYFIFWTGRNFKLIPFEYMSFLKKDDELWRCRIS
jgi:hypothetical protein